MRKNNSTKIALDPISKKHKNPQSLESEGRSLLPNDHTPNYSRRNKVKKNHWITLTIGMALVLGIYAVPAAAQQPAQQGPPFFVAVIDVAQVIRQHPIFMERQEALQGHIRQAEAQFQQRQEAIAARQRALEASQFRPGSPEHQQQLDSIVNEVADFERDARTQQRRFALENSRIMYDTYQDIRAIIGRYAMARGIAQVTDIREFEVNPADPQTVAEEMDQRLVWFNPSLNITQQIIGEVFAAHGRTMPAPTATPGQQPVR